MASGSDDPPEQQTSAPDLEILGDQVTLHPSGYIEPPKRHDDGKEHALMHHSARFRKSPLERVFQSSWKPPAANLPLSGSYEKSLFMCRVQGGAPTTIQLGNRYSTMASRKT